MFPSTVEWPEWSWLSPGTARQEGGEEASTSGEEHCGFDRLPAELLHEVLACMGSARDQAVCKLVCKHWNRSLSQLTTMPLLLAASESNALQVWDVLGGTLAYTEDGHSPGTAECSCQASGPAWREQVQNHACATRGHSARLWCCESSPDGRRMLSGSADNTLKVWSASAGGSGAWVLRRAAAAAEVAGDFNAAAAVEHLADFVATLGSAEELLSRTDEGAAMSPSTSSSSPSSSSSSLPRLPAVLQETFALSLERHRGTGSSEVVVRERDGGRCVGRLPCRTLHTLRGHSHWVLDCRVFSDGVRAVSASADLTLKVWDLVSGQATATLKGHTDWVRACDVSPDGSRIASGGYDRTVMLWDAATGRHQRSLTGHAGWVWSVAFSPCGRLVVSGSEDCTAKLWETTTGRCVATLRGHSHYVRSVQFWDGGRYVISTSDDCTVKVWSVAEALANEERCGAVGVGCEALEHAASVRSVPRGVFVKWQAAGRVPLSHSQLELSLHVQPSGGGGGGGGGGGSGSYDECCGRSVILTASGELVWCDACVRTLGGATDSIISATVSSDGRWLATATHNLACTSPHGGGLVFPGGSDACCDVSSKKTSLMSRLLQSPLLGLSGLSLLSGGLALTCAEPKPKPAAGAACLRVWDTTTWTLKAELRGDAHRIAAVRFLAAPPPSPVC